MRGVTKIALGVLLASFAGVTAEVAVEAAEEEVKMVFHVEGLR